jgi:hypothetical protein
MHVKFIKLAYCVLRNANNLNNATTKLDDLHFDLQTYLLLKVMKITYMPTQHEERINMNLVIKLEEI